MSFLDEIDDLHEHQRLELKESSFDVPDDVWESYSAFANTEGGEIVLGVTENTDHTFALTGVIEPDELVGQFWTTVRNTQKVERDVLFGDSVRVVAVNGVKVIVIDVPRAERGDKPVRVKGRRGKRFVAWIRRGSSDVKATADDLRQMEYDNASRADRIALRDFSVASLNDSTIARYRIAFSGRKPSSPWNRDSKEDFLYHIGALARSHDGTLCPTQAGLLAFGNEYEITNYLPHFFLDYRQRTGGSTRWEDRIVSQDGDWSGNLVDFYFDVTSRLLHSFAAPFTADATGTRHGVGNPVTEAVNEAVANAIIHSYYGGVSTVTVVLDDDELVVTNPGNFLIDRDVAIAGGVSEQRNPTLMRIFAFIGVSDRAGSGVQTLFDTWRGRFGTTPLIVEEHSPAVVRLALPFPEGVISNGQVGRGSILGRRRTTLDDERLFDFIIESREGVSSVEVSEAFGVSRRVAQKHLAALYADPKRHISRLDGITPYVYLAGGADASMNRRE